ncbi:MAG TPA: VWA domain-containing protein [Candidatus Acidoferrales bacterium]|nr:VWA domain-containing protein [Candidatus Acidoferrales bacterium]
MMRRALPIIFAFALTASAQQVGQNKENNAAPKISVNTQLVVEQVTVTDKKGNAIKGLTAKDFTLTENGQTQELKFCEPIQLTEVPAGELAPQPAQPENIKIYNKLAHTEIAPEQPGNLKYRDHRLISLYFDMTAMPPADQARALSAAEKFIRTQMTPADLISVMRYSGSGVDVLVDFTDDRNHLLSIIQTLIVGEGQGLEEAEDDSSASDTGAAFGQDDAEFNIFNTDRQLSALQTASKMLGHLNEKKSLIYFASGLRLNGIDNQAQLHATVDSAIRSGVTIWAIDARGLVAQAPLGDATRGSPGGQAMYTGASALAMTANLQQTQDSLYGLATDTGGKALLDFNDLSMGIVEAQHAVSSYYILGYYTTNATLDGKFRRIKIALNSDTPADLEYRQGYFAGKVFGKFTTADKDRQLEDALMLEEPITELTIAMEIDYFQLNRAEYFVPVVMKIPGRELALAKKGGAERTQIDFIGEIKDAYGGRTVTNLHDKVTIKLSDATAAELAKRPIEYDTGYTLLPGKYNIKVLARDDETGRIGTYQTTFVIPNLNKEDRLIPISSVVLSSQRVDLKDALFNAKNNDKQEVANPLVVNNQKLIPSVTRVFSKSRDMYVYLQAYEQGVTAVQPLIGFVSFYQAQTKAYETAPMKLATGMTNHLNTMPLNFDISLKQIPVGEYDCQVTVLNPAGQKVAFWRAPVKLVP